MHFQSNQHSILLLTTLALLCLQVGCKKESSVSSQPPTVIGTWTMTSMQSTGGKFEKYGKLPAAMIGNAQLILRSDGTFVASGTVLSSSAVTQSLILRDGTSASAIGVYSITGNSILFTVTSWSGQKTGSAQGSYTLSDNSFEVTLQYPPSSTMTISFSRAQ